MKRNRLSSRKRISADAAELGPEPDAQLPAMPLSEEVVADYQMLRLSLKAHPMQFLRDGFAREGVLSCAETNAASDGRKVACASTCPLPSAATC